MIRTKKIIVVFTAINTGFLRFQKPVISPTNDSFLKPKNCCDIVGYVDITSLVIVGNLTIYLTFFALISNHNILIPKANNFR